MGFRDAQTRAVCFWSQALLLKTGCFSSVVLSSSLRRIQPLPTDHWYSDISGARLVFDQVIFLFSDAYVIYARQVGPWWLRARTLLVPSNLA